mmetsp:Transcript_153598/g.492312  ORF Transcript_153598/g.492312 Transcript_153598/m.492312 type:complete len:253 (+) Transcript_153598:3910-4668(+)
MAGRMSRQQFLLRSFGQEDTAEMRLPDLSWLSNWRRLDVANGPPECSNSTRKLRAQDKMTSVLLPSFAKLLVVVHEHMAGSSIAMLVLRINAQHDHIRSQVLPTPSSFLLLRPAAQPPAREAREHAGPQGRQLLPQRTPVAEPTQRAPEIRHLCDRFPHRGRILHRSTECPDGSMELYQGLVQVHEHRDRASLIFLQIHDGYRMHFFPGRTSPAGVLALRANLRHVTSSNLVRTQAVLVLSFIACFLASRAR